MSVDCKKVSMVITCYNKQDYIGRMLDSVIAQIYDNIEVVIVNDGSTDSSLDVINSYIPKLKQRGYEVIIVNQENMGRAPALRSGLKIVTGEYVCFPDGDDILLEEYVSAPFEYLEVHKDVDFVVSDTVEIPHVLLDNPYLKSRNNICFDELSNNQILQMLLLNYNVRISLNTLVSRAEYIVRCNIAENIASRKDFTQETQVMLPLFMYGGKAHYLNKVTYDYDRSVPASVTGISRCSRENADENVKKYTESAIYTLMKHNAFEDKRWFTLLKIRELYGLFKTSPFHNEQELIRELLNCVNIGIDEETAYKIGFSVLHYYVSNRICQVCLNTEIEPLDTEEIIAYGVYGRASRQILTGLLNSDTKITAFWDTAAKDGDRIAGVPVAKPDFTSLRSKRVTILVLLRNLAISKEVTKSIYAVNKDTRIMYFYDIMDYLVRYHLDGVNVDLRIG